MPIEWIEMRDPQTPTTWYAKVGKDRVVTTHNSDGVQTFTLHPGYYDKEDTPPVTELLIQKRQWKIVLKDEDGILLPTRNQVDTFRNRFIVALKNHPHGRESTELVFHRALSEALVEHIPRKIDTER